MQYRPLSSFADVKGGKRLPNGKTLTVIPSAHPYIRVRDLGIEKVLELTPTYEFVDEETQRTISRYIVNTGDVIISIVGTIGLVAKIGATLDGANLTENCAKLVNISRLDKDFLYYYLMSEDGQNAIKAATVGAVQAKLPLKNIQSLPIPVMSLEKQRKIAETLSAFDDKIALNTQIYHHLEQLAQAMFKSWFVDFEPWGGMMSDNWCEVEFSSFLTPRVEKSNDPQIPLFSVTDNGIFPRDQKFNKALSKATTLNKIARKTDLVFGMSREILNWGIMRDQIGGVSSAYNVFKVDDKINSKYLESFIKTHEAYFKDLIRPASREGQSVDKAALMNKSIYIPTSETLAEYYCIEDPLTVKIKELVEENACLAKLRDSLLLRLMSGELSVTDIQMS